MIRNGEDGNQVDQIIHLDNIGHKIQAIIGEREEGHMGLILVGVVIIGVKIVGINQ